jgi:1-phosphofructokinase family hexose kinase
MIVSVTANTTLDQTLFVPFIEMGRTVRATQTVQSMGGKPTDASWILGELGTPSLALGFAAGAMGERVVKLLQARGVTVDFVWVGGETRINTVVVVEGQGQFTITTSTLEVAPDHIAQLLARYDEALSTATCVVTGGTLPKAVPPSYYVGVIGKAKQRGIPVIFDADEPNLSAGLQARPDFIKPNHHELEALTGKPINTIEDAYAAGREIVAKYGTQPIITLGEKGALAVLHDKAYHMPPLDIPVVSASGAGDGVLAGITWAASQRKPIEEGLRLGIAAASAVCMLPGTADCRKEDVERLLPQVQLIPYHE